MLEHLRGGITERRVYCLSGCGIVADTWMNVPCNYLSTLDRHYLFALIKAFDGLIKFSRTKGRLLTRWRRGDSSV